jgi:hypothetical protein
MTWVAVFLPIPPGIGHVLPESTVPARLASVAAPVGAIALEEVV